MLRTCHEWISKLAAESSVIAEMQLETDTENGDLNTDAVNLANCNVHCRLIACAFDKLVTHNFSSKESARELLCRLIRRTTDGAFAEVAAYDWLTRCNVRIETQVAMPPSDVLGAQGVKLDGKIAYDGTFFDVKAFRLNGGLAQRLKEQLEKEIPDEQVLIEESWDLSSKTFQDLIGSARNIASELRQKRTVRKGHLRIRLEAKKPVTVSMWQSDPYCLARENALFPYKNANQFTRNKPFILIFVVHPWFNAGSIGFDSAGVDPIFSRSLARRAFMQFSTDSTPLNTICQNVPSNVTLAEASRLLSAIFFVGVRPFDANPTIARLYLNPRATHRLRRGSTVSLFGANNPPGTYIDDFADDDY